MTRQSLILRYTTFATLATLANLATQREVLLFGNSPSVVILAIAAGTIVGLLIKYVLDKRWVFYDSQTGVLEHGKKFTLYVGMGLITTAVFWGAECAFWVIWNSDAMREIGAILGLSVGYAMKYYLDRRYVFTDAQSRATV